MAPLSFWPLHGTNGSRKDMVGVFRDIDDTLTTEGAITPDALQALQNLKDAGRMFIPITGRLPVGQWVGAFFLHQLGQSTPSFPRTAHSLTAQRAKKPSQENLPTRPGHTHA